MTDQLIIEMVRGATHYGAPVTSIAPESNENFQAAKAFYKGVGPDAFTYSSHPYIPKGQLVITTTTYGKYKVILSWLFEDGVTLEIARDRIPHDADLYRVRIHASTGDMDELLPYLVEYESQEEGEPCYESE